MAPDKLPYLMIDLKRLNIGVRDLVTLMEQALVDYLKNWDIDASPRSDARGFILRRT